MLLIRVLLIIVAILIISRFIIKQKYKSDRNKRVKRVYVSGNDVFNIVGTKNEFKITKNNGVSFLVKDGRIIACKDNRVSNEYKYYGR